MLTIEQIRPHLLYKFQNIQELVAPTAKLWENFTSNRSNIGDYLKDEQLVSAYTAFYLMTNHQKLEALLNYAGIDAESLEQYHVYDLGSGPGTFLVAFSEIVFGRVGKLIGIEKSELMRKQAKLLLSGLGVNDFLIGERVPEKLDGKRMAIFGHSFNEMGIANARKYLRSIEPETIFVIEPGTKECFKELLTLRDELISQGYECIFPCPTAGRCPMQGSEQDWCHQYMRIEMDDKVKSLAQNLKLDRHLQAVSAFVFTRNSELGKKSEKRMVRYYRQTKHSFDWQVCEKKDAGNHLQDLEVAKRGMSKSEIKETENIYPGKSVDYEFVKELPDKVRVALKSFPHSDNL